MSAFDIQVGGDHYKSMPIQPMQYSMANGLDACQHTVIKYVTRFREKGGVQDLEKAKHVIDMLIESEKEKRVTEGGAGPDQATAIMHDILTKVFGEELAGSRKSSTKSDSPASKLEREVTESLRRQFPSVGIQVQFLDEDSGSTD